MDTNEIAATLAKSTGMNTTKAKNTLFRLCWVMFEKIPEIFPDRRFVWSKFTGGWCSPYHIDGSKSADDLGDTSFISAIWPDVIQEHDGTTANVIEFYARYTKQSIETALRDLCNLCGVEC